MGRKQDGGGSVMLSSSAWKTRVLVFMSMLLWSVSSTWILFYTQVHSFVTMVFPNGGGLFQQDNVPWHMFPGSKSIWASVECAGKTSLIHGSPTSQLTGIIGSAANVLLPDTTRHLQRSCKVNALMCQSCFGGIYNIRKVVFMLWLMYIQKNMGMTIA